VTRVRALLGSVAVAAALLASLRLAGADEEEVVAKARATITAAGNEGGPALEKALGDAQALVGPSASFPDAGAFADWLGTMPEAVAKTAAVRTRRAWLYLCAKRGQDALEPLQQVLSERPDDPTLLLYLGDAKRLAGDVDGAIAAFSDARKHGAAAKDFADSLHRMLYDLHANERPGEGEGLPRWLSAGEKALALVEAPRVRLDLVVWLGAEADASAERSAKRAADLRFAAARVLWPALVRPSEAPDVAPYLARAALDAAGWVRSRGAARPDDVPEAFDLLGMAVRLGASPTGEGHQLPEALAGLAEEALAKGRFLLASTLARRRLAISDSPGARRVLLAVPPSVGD
jgi:hypothetical protein